MRFNKDLHLLHGRIKIFRAFIVGFFLITVYGFFRIQIINQIHYEALGEKYRIKTLPVKAERGLFFSREGNLLVENLPTYTLVLHREEMSLSWENVLPEVAGFFHRDPSLIDYNYQIHKGLYLGLPIPLIHDLDFKEVLSIKRQQDKFPFLNVEVTSERYHRLAFSYSHILGFVGAVTPRQLIENPSLRPGDSVGRTGLERQYDSLLMGAEGQKSVQIDSRGVFHQVIQTQPSVPGADMVLSLSEELQQRAVSIIGDQTGIILLMDVNSGEILAYYSSPTYDLNLFTGGIDQKSWDALNQSSLTPLFNRPIQGTYAPGSTFKIVTALAGLKSGKITPSTRVMCSGSIDYLGREFHCHKESGHGWLDLSEALMQSCNVYLYQIAKEISAEDLASVAKSLGLGVRTGIDLPGEALGIVPSPTWKKEKYKKIWYPGETLSMAIGQGDLQVTAIQMLRLMALISNDGLAANPHFLKEYHQGKKILYPETQVFQAEGIAPGFFKIVRHAMWRTINQDSGTGAHARIPGFEVCGKTGTAQVITFQNDIERKDKKYQNAWFVGFAPYQKPEVAVVVLVEHAGHGGETAAPLARQLLEAYLQSTVRKQILDSF